MANLLRVESVRTAGGGGVGLCHQDLTGAKSRIMFVINWLRVFFRSLPTAGLVGISGYFYQHHLSPTLSPIQSNGGEGARAFWTVVGFRWRVGILGGWDKGHRDEKDGWGEWDGWSAGGVFDCIWAIKS